MNSDVKLAEANNNFYFSIKNEQQWNYMDDTRYKNFIKTNIIRQR